MKTVKHQFDLFSEAEIFTNAIKEYGDKKMIEKVDSCFDYEHDKVIVTVTLKEAKPKSNPNKIYQYNCKKIDDICGYKEPKIGDVFKFQNGASVTFYSTPEIHRGIVMVCCNYVGGIAKTVMPKMVGLKDLLSLSKIKSIEH